MTRQGVMINGKGLRDQTGLQIDEGEANEVVAAHVEVKNTTPIGIVLMDGEAEVDFSNIVASNTGVTGLKAITTANTPEQITATSTPIKRVVIQAKSSNVGTIVIGFANTVRASPSASINGIDLQAGDAYTVDINNLNKVWIDASISGESVTYHYSV